MTKMNDTGDRKTTIPGIAREPAPGNCSKCGATISDYKTLCDSCASK